MSWRLATALALSGLAGCSTTPMAGVVRSVPTAAPVAPAMAAGGHNCRFHVIKIEDLREEKDLGRMGRRAVEGRDFEGWFSDGLTRMPGYDGKDARVQVQVQVLKAYIQGLSTLKSANLVVRVRIEAPGRAPLQRNYRGFDDSMNWANGEEEMQTAFDRALADLTRQLQADLKAACD